MQLGGVDVAEVPSIPRRLRHMKHLSAIAQSISCCVEADANRVAYLYFVFHNVCALLGCWFVLNFNISVTIASFARL